MMNDEIMWGATGLSLIIADVLFGTFFVLFLGFAALLVAVFAWTGLLTNPLYQWVLFAVFSSAGVILGRAKLQQWFGPGKEDKYNEHQGHFVEVVEAIEGNKQGKVKYRGTEWLAVSNTAESFSIGETAQIAKLDGIVIYITKKES